MKVVKKIIDQFNAFVIEHDEGYVYDEIFNFVDGELGRGDLLNVFKSLSATAKWLEKYRAEIPPSAFVELEEILR